MARLLPKSTTIDDLVSAADRLRGCDDQAAVLAGTLVQFALGNRLFAEVRSGRLPPEALRSLALG